MDRKEYIRLQAYEFILLLGINSLPIKLNNLSEQKLGLRIVSYSKAQEVIRLMKFEQLANERKCFTILELKLILYSDELSYSERMCAILHEFGHYRLGHKSVGKILGDIDEAGLKRIQEDEADYFMYCVLAPIPILAQYKDLDCFNFIYLTKLPVETGQQLWYEVSLEIEEYNNTVEKQLEARFSESVSTTELYKFKKIDVDKLALTSQRVVITILVLIIIYYILQNDSLVFYR